MSRHTPGPWRHDDPDSGRMTQVFSGENATDGFLVAYVIHESVNEEQKATDEGNARLIAAAPDMLRALRQAEDGLASSLATWRQENGDNTSVIGALRFVRKAISKAQGES